MAKLPLVAASVLLGACVVNTNPPEFADDPPRRDTPSSSSSSSSGWIKLGETKVDGKNDHDNVMVGSGKGAFRSIRLKVTDSTLRMHDVAVEFTDGTKFSPPTQTQFTEGDRTGVIDLPGGRREIRRVGLRYSDVRGGGFAHVEVWGRR